MRRRNDELKVSKITVEIPMDLAIELFIETGDLAMDKYPALEELAGVIAQVLNVDKIQESPDFQHDKESS